MRATSDFKAHVNGADYAIRKGEEFRGDARTAEHLKAIGLLAETKKAKEGTDNER
ncbi:MAG: hypothetical protein SOW20_04565 [Berryella intestinalis]|uniref:hypothetical protein n=1 Tax=Berryella intestinalis TaxID=1531429 RepID=UPI002A506201|nr:hypothetical protein [Berryella intestinalis]MDD7369720.1 hypothetical protein [Berryella intestinalis]MDY3129285.1 hypothetical protein [Berryella intestinalis]